MKMIKTAELDGWVLYTVDSYQPGKELLMAAHALAMCADHEIAFAVIGETGSFAAMELDGVQTFDATAMKCMEKAPIFPPDFETMLLDYEGKTGALLMMGNCWQVLTWQKTKLSKCNIDIGCAVNARGLLMESVEKKQILGAFLPKEAEESFVKSCK